MRSQVWLLGAPALLALLAAHVSFGLEIDFPAEAQRPERVLHRLIDRRVDAVVEAVVREDRGFEVTAALYGKLPAGSRLDFDRCRGGAMAERLRHMVGGARLVDTGLDDTARASLPQVASLDMLPTPDRDARFLLLLRGPTRDGSWELPRLGFGDLFLIQHNRAYFQAPGRLDDRTRPFWLPYEPQPVYSRFRLDLDRMLAARERGRSVE